MPQYYTAMGESTASAEVASRAAYGQIASDAKQGEARVDVISLVVPMVEGGFRVFLTVIVYDAEEKPISEISSTQPENGPIDRIVGDDQPDMVAVYAAHVHQQDLDALFEQMEREATEPVVLPAEDPAVEFEHAAGSDAGYVYPYIEGEDKKAEYISTTLDTAEIADSTLGDLLASDDVVWRDVGVASAPALAPDSEIDFEKPADEEDEGGGSDEREPASQQAPQQAQPAPEDEPKLVA